MVLAIKPLLLLMLTDLLPHTLRYLNQLTVSPLRMRKRQHPISILRIWMKEHRTPEMGYLKRVKQSIPLSHPVVPGAVEDECGVISTEAGRLFNVACLFVFDCGACGMLFDPVVSLVLFVCEDCGGSVLA